MSLSKTQTLHLRALARRLEPTARIGREGITPELVEVVNGLLAARELVKVRYVSRKDERRALSRELASATESALIDVVGHVAVLYRAQPEPVEGAISLSLPD